MRRFAALAAVLVVMLGLVLAGCGGSDDSSSDDDSEQVDTPDDASDNSSDDEASEFAQRLEDQAKVRVKVTYETNNGDVVYTISQDGSGKQAIFADDTVYISDGDSVLTCNTADGSATCIDNPAAMGQAALLPFTGALTAASDTIKGARDVPGGFGDASTEEIAGREADCYEVKFGGSYKVCADAETGILLKSEVSGGGETASLVAIEVTEPDDSDFEPPAGATVETLPSLGG
jgi:hypothetical protein